MCGYPHNPPSEDMLGRIKSTLDEKTLEYSVDHIKDVLKQLRLHSYYENTQTIFNVLNNKSPLIIDDDLLKYLEDHFTEICECYEEVASPRTSFLSYVFVTRKLLELAKQELDTDEVIDELIRAFPLLPCEEKYKQNMTVWHKIRQKLDWQYIT